MTYELDAAGIGRLESVLRGNRGAPRGEASSGVLRALRDGDPRRARAQERRAAGGGGRGRPRGRRSGRTIIFCTSSASRSGTTAHPRVRGAARGARHGVARAHQRMGDRRHGISEAGPRVARRAAAVHGVDREGRQLPDRREPDALHADRARAGRHAAVPARVVDERPRSMREGEDPARGRGFARSGRSLWR